MKMEQIMINCGKRLVIGASKVVNIEAAKNSNEYPINSTPHSPKQLGFIMTISIQKHVVSMCGCNNIVLQLMVIPSQGRW